MAREGRVASIRSVIGGLLLASFTGPLAADVHISETTSAKIGGRSIEVLRSTYIKGSRMRIETTQTNESTTTLYDLPGGTTIALDAKKRRAEIRDIGVRHAQLQREYPRERVEIKMTPTGAAKTIVDASCDEHAFTIRVPMTKDGRVGLVMSGSAWMAMQAPGADDYAAFASAANERQLVLGPNSNNKILLGVTRAQTELYRALGALHGIPYLVDMTLTVDGGGLLASMVRKVISGTRTSAVTSVTAAPLPDTLFTIPEGWSCDRK